MKMNTPTSTRFLTCISTSLAPALLLFFLLTGCVTYQHTVQEPIHFEATGTAVLRDADQPLQNLGPSCATILEGTGTGHPSLNAANETQKQSTALEAARYRALAQIIEKRDGLYISRTAHVQNMVFAGEELSVKLSGVIEDASTVYEKYDADTEVGEVLLRVALDVNGQVIQQSTVHQPFVSIDRRMAEAEAAARINATAAIREDIGRIFVTQVTEIKNMKVKSQTTQLKMEGLLQGVKFSDTRWLDETCCEVTASIELNPRQLRYLTKR